MADSASWSGSPGRPGGALQRLVERLAPEATSRVNLEMLRPADIEPSPLGPRPVLDPESLRELAEHVLSYGIEEPLLVRRVGIGRYQLLSGARPLAAAQQVHLPAIPVRVIEIDDATAAAIALTETLSREGLTPWEEAQGLAELRQGLEVLGHPAAAQELSLLTGHSAAWVRDRLRIADRLTPAVLEHAGVAVHDLNVITREALCKAAEPEDEAQRAARLQRAVASEDRRLERPR